METPVLVMAGAALAGAFRGGDCSATEFDPTTPAGFWSANEFQFDTSGDNTHWGTQIAEYNIPNLSKSSLMSQTATEGASTSFPLGSITDDPCAGPWSASASFGVIVSDPAVTPTGGFSFAAVEGSLSAVQTVATFLDPGGAEPNPADPTDGIPSHYKVASIDWGDATPLDTTTGAIAFSGTPGSKTDPFTVSGSHVYASEGTFTVTVILDHEGIKTTVKPTATIKDDIGLLLLDPTGSKSLMVTGNGSVTATKCGAVVVDSSNPSDAAFPSGHGTVTAMDIDVTGGTKVAGQASFSGPVDHEAPTADPLGLKLPAPPATHFAAVHVSGGSVPLSPGTYDGGITVDGTASVTLAPGVYFMNGGGFTVTDQGSISGTGVLLVNAPLSPSDTISFSGQASVSLSAPPAGRSRGSRFSRIRRPRTRSASRARRPLR
jgi:hypothetical protein